ncbi:hypothetical protein FKM82_008828 [Ascaphus truei]
MGGEDSTSLSLIGWGHLIRFNHRSVKFGSTGAALLRMYVSSVLPPPTSLLYHAARLHSKLEMGLGRGEAGALCERFEISLPIVPCDGKLLFPPFFSPPSPPNRK